MSTLIVDTVRTDTIQDEAGAFEHAKLVQVVNTMVSATATGTTTVPEDDTIPQKTEGDEYMTLAITPTHASNKLLIEVVCCCSHGNSGVPAVVALFQDADAGAIAAISFSNYDTNDVWPGSFVHYMTTGTTSSTTFRVRAGKNPAGSNAFVFNGTIGTGRLLGGVMASSITISEIRV